MKISPKPSSQICKSVEKDEVSGRQFITEGKLNKKDEELGR